MSSFKRGFGLTMGHFAAKAVIFIVVLLVILFLASIK